jgi:hypothetical protein
MSSQPHPPRFNNIRWRKQHPHCLLTRTFILTLSSQFLLCLPSGHFPKGSPKFYVIFLPTHPSYTFTNNARWNLQIMKIRIIWYPSFANYFTVPMIRYFPMRSVFRHLQIGVHNNTMQLPSPRISDWHHNGIQKDIYIHLFLLKNNELYGSKSFFKNW